MRALGAQINYVLAWLIFAGANLQIFLIALAVFGAASSEVHAWNGRILMLLGLLALIAALVARSSRLNIGITILMAVLLVPVQGALAYETFPSPWINALHGATGMAILWLAYSLAYGRARATVPATLQPSRLSEAD